MSPEDLENMDIPKDEEGNIDYEKLKEKFEAMAAEDAEKWANEQTEESVEESTETDETAEEEEKTDL